MNINRNNYEIWFLDFLEGRLNLEQQKELEAFLVQNPDLKAELNEMELLTVPKENIRFENKQSLKKIGYGLSGSISDNQDEYFIAYHENDLSPEQKAEVETFAQKDKETLKIFSLYSKLKAEPDNTIVYAEKKKLYQRPTFSFYRVAVAAAAILILTVLFLIPSNDNELKVRFAFNDAYKLIFLHSNPSEKAMPQPPKDFINTGSSIDSDIKIKENSPTKTQVNSNQNNEFHIDFKSIQYCSTPIIPASKALAEFNTPEKRLEIRPCLGYLAPDFLLQRQLENEQYANAESLTAPNNVAANQSLLGLVASKGSRLFGSILGEREDELKLKDLAWGNWGIKKK